MAHDARLGSAFLDYQQAKEEPWDALVNKPFKQLLLNAINVCAYSIYAEWRPEVGPAMSADGDGCLLNGRGWSVTSGLLFAAVKVGRDLRRTIGQHKSRRSTLQPKPYVVYGRHRGAPHEHDYTELIEATDGL
jgi:hypothetical protein